MNRRLATGLAAAVLALASALPAAANDGWGGAPSESPNFSQNRVISIVSQDLYLSVDEVRVDYIFANPSSNDITGTIIFPMPLTLPGIDDLDWQSDIWITSTGPGGSIIPPSNLPSRAEIDRPNQYEFRAQVEGREIPVTSRLVAVWDEGAASNSMQVPSLMQLTDITARLAALGVPMTRHLPTVIAALDRLPAAQRAELIREGLVQLRDGEVLGRHWPMWQIGEQLLRTQTFPAGSRISVNIRYRPVPPGGLFYTQTFDDPAYRDFYCVNQATRAVAERRIPYDRSLGGRLGYASYVSYILTSATTWAGPIGRFRVTLDKQQDNATLSVCARGLVRSGPNQWTWERVNFTPTEDIHFIVVTPPPNSQTR